jgi:hypothetical protein
MWSAVIGGLSSLVKSWFDLKSAKNKAEAERAMAMAKVEADWDVMALEQAKHSWKDEFITLVWFAPLIVAWFEQERAMQWIDFVSGLPLFYQIGMFGIIAASFGLRWYFKQQGFNVAKNMRGE